MKLDIGIEKRAYILTMSLLIESYTAIFLSRLLEIKQDYKKTISFGNKSTNLSFNQKINLLIDIGAIPVGEKAKFKTFMEIRNQFMHNLEAKSYEKCFEFLEGKEIYILKKYPQEVQKSREEQLKNATEQLTNDVVGMAIKLLDKVKDKIRKEVKFDLLEKSQPVLIKAFAEFSKSKIKKFG